MSPMSEDERQDAIDYLTDMTIRQAVDGKDFFEAAMQIELPADQPIPTSCMNPECKGDCGSELLWTCINHQDAPVSFTTTGDVATVYCTVCDGIVARLRVSGLVMM